jgi:uncharacterized membrane protein
MSDALFDANGLFQPNASSTLPEAFTTRSFTMPWSRILCIDEMYAVHVMLAYISCIAGLVALVARVYEPMKWLHVHAGRTWLMGMFFTAVSSLLIITTGLPRSIAAFMAIMAFSVSISFGIIRFAQTRFQQAVVQKADELCNGGAIAAKKPSELVAAATTQLLTAPKTWQQRLFSLKAAHGYLMTLGWLLMASRMLVTNPSTAWRGCWTYPAIKNSQGVVAGLVPEVDPNFIQDELSFFLAMLITPIVLLLVVGFVWSVCASRLQAKALAGATTNPLK